MYYCDKCGASCEMHRSNSKILEFFTSLSLHTESAYFKVSDGIYIFCDGKSFETSLHDEKIYEVPVFDEIYKLFNYFVRDLMWVSCVQGK